MPETTFQLGKWKAVCDICGFRYHNTDLAKQWDGLMACRGPGTNNCFSARHPQDFVRGVRDRQAPPWTRPPPKERFTREALIIDGRYVTVDGKQVYLEPNDVTEDDL